MLLKIVRVKRFEPVEVRKKESERCGGEGWPADPTANEIGL
jgi:hypothetical protein